MWWVHDAGSGWWIFSAIWTSLVATIVWTVGKHYGSADSWDDPLEIARRRYARGEISQQQFEQLQKEFT